MRKISSTFFKEFQSRMNRTFSLVLLASGLAATAAFAQVAPSPSASATKAPAPVAMTAKIAIIEFQPGTMQTNEGKAAMAALQQKYEPTQVKLKGLSDEIDSLKKQLAAGGEKLTEEERASRAKTIDTKEKQLQRDAEDAQGSFQGEASDVYQKIAAKVYQTVQTYAQQNGYTLVVDISGQQSPVLWANPATDITAAVIEAYNAKSGVPAPPVNAPTPTRSTTPHSSTTTPHTTTAKPKP